MSPSFTPYAMSFTTSVNSYLDEYAIATLSIDLRNTQRDAVIMQQKTKLGENINIKRTYTNKSELHYGNYYR